MLLRQERHFPQRKTLVMLKNDILRCAKLTVATGNVSSAESMLLVFISFDNFQMYFTVLRVITENELSLIGVNGFRELKFNCKKKIRNNQYIHFWRGRVMEYCSFSTFDSANVAACTRMA